MAVKKTTSLRLALQPIQHPAEGEHPGIVESCRFVTEHARPAKPVRLFMKSGKRSIRRPVCRAQYLSGVVDALDRLRHRVEAVEHGLVAKRAFAPLHHRVARRSNKPRRRSRQA